jgi:hypothetical protein
MNFAAPVVVEHDGIAVVRDDLIGGGTKARYMARLFESAEEIVYATPAEGGAQTALAWTAREMGKKATLFVAKRKQPHARALMAKALGASVWQVAPGYLTVAQARARSYCEATGATLAPFGMDLPEAIEVISAAALSTGLEPDEVWCAGGSGVLARGLAQAWPRARRHVVQVGRELSSADVAGAAIHVHPLAFGKEARIAPPFPTRPGRLRLRLEGDDREIAIFVDRLRATGNRIDLVGLQPGDVAGLDQGDDLGQRRAKSLVGVGREIRRRRYLAALRGRQNVSALARRRFRGRGGRLGHRTGLGGLASGPGGRGLLGRIDAWLDRRANPRSAGASTPSASATCAILSSAEYFP